MTNHEWTGPTKAAEGMNPDLEWLARNINEWGGTNYVTKEGEGSAIWTSKPFNTGDSYSEAQWLQARKDLGLDYATPEQEADWHKEEPWAESVPEGVETQKRTAPEFLRQAADLIVERGKRYDKSHGERSIKRTIDAFNAITGRDLSEPEGWLIMSLFKRVRQYSGAGYHQDSAEDAVAYAALEAEALEGNKQTDS